MEVRVRRPFVSPRERLLAGRASAAATLPSPTIAAQQGQAPRGYARHRITQSATMVSPATASISTPQAAALEVPQPGLLSPPRAALPSGYPVKVSAMVRRAADAMSGPTPRSSPLPASASLPQWRSGGGRPAASSPSRKGALAGVRGSAPRGLRSPPVSPEMSQTVSAAKHAAGLPARARGSAAIPNESPVDAALRSAARARHAAVAASGSYEASAWHALAISEAHRDRAPGPGSDPALRQAEETNHSTTGPEAAGHHHRTSEEEALAAAGSTAPPPSGVLTFDSWFAKLPATPPQPPAAPSSGLAPCVDQHDADAGSGQEHDDELVEGPAVRITPMPLTSVDGRPVSSSRESVDGGFGGDRAHRVGRTVWDPSESAVYGAHAAGLDAGADSARSGARNFGYGEREAVDEQAWLAFAERYSGPSDRTPRLPVRRRGGSWATEGSLDEPEGPGPLGDAQGDHHGIGWTDDERGSLKSAELLRQCPGGGATAVTSADSADRGHALHGQALLDIVMAVQWQQAQAARLTALLARLVDS
jgi:hypothetical protein